MNEVEGEFDKALDPQNQTILIIDDEPANLAVVADYLAQSGFQIKVAQTGEAGLELARRTPPALILLDVRLPGMDGFETCRRLKADERTHDIPVIFMTIVTRIEDKVRGFETGGVDYITKPFQHEEVLARVSAHLRIRDLTQKLEEVNASLEQRVLERTSELTQANIRLENEITERIQAEEALRQERDLVARIMETSPISITVVNCDGQVAFANSQAERVLGLSKDELSQRAYNAPAWHITDLAGDPFPDEKLPFRQVMTTRQSVYDVQHAIEWPNGYRVLLSINGAPLLNESGQVESVVFALEDISERKQTEMSLRHLNRELRAISNCNQVLMRAMDEQTLLNDICRIVCDEAGYRLAWVGYVEHDEAKTVRPVAWGGLDDEYVANVKLSWVEDAERAQGPGGIAIHSGEIVYIQDLATDPRMAQWRESAMQRGYRSVIGLPLKDEKANVFGVLLIYSLEVNAFLPAEIRLLEELAGDLAFGICVLRTRARHKLAEDALRKNENQLSEAQRIAHIGSWQLDIVNNVLYWSDEIYKIFEIDPKQFGASYDAFLNTIHPDDREAVNFAYTNSLKTRTAYAIDHRLQFADGRIKYVHEQCETIYDADNKPVHSLGIVQDVTERKRADDEIRKLNQELEQRVAERTIQLEAANKELEAFAYSVSHDLRAPLRHIGGFVEMLKQSTEIVSDEQSRHYIDVISDAVQRMRTMIGDLLSFSRMSRSAMSSVRVDLGALVGEVIQEFEIETKNREIEWQISSLPEVNGDRAMLRMVFENLISNALKFTKSRAPAKIEIGWMPGSEAENVVFIRDNGVGFDMQYTDKLFGVFQRLHRTDEFEGTGIGLANVRRIINRHGGRTWAEGEVDQGATFYFSLPHTGKDD